VSSQVKKIVVYTDVLDPQYAHPDTHDDFFKRGTRAHIGFCQRWARLVECRQSAALDLAVWREWEGIETHID
jgi:hypothetical protein